MFKQILVTLDGSPGAETVIQHASDLAASMKAEVTLLRIVDAVNSEWSERGAVGKSNAESTIRTIFTDQAQQYLERVAAELRRAVVTVHVLVKQGQPARLIVSTARESACDVIIMATHSRRGINKLVFGSVAEEVIHESNLPVLLIRSA